MDFKRINVLGIGTIQNILINVNEAGATTVKGSEWVQKTIVTSTGAYGLTKSIIDAIEDFT